MPIKVSLRAVRKEISIQNTEASVVWVFSTNRVATIAIDEMTILRRRKRRSQCYSDSVQLVEPGNQMVGSEFLLYSPLFSLVNFSSAVYYLNACNRLRNVPKRVLHVQSVCFAY